MTSTRDHAGGGQVEAGEEQAARSVGHRDAGAGDGQVNVGEGQVNAGEVRFEENRP